MGTWISPLFGEYFLKRAQTPIYSCTDTYRQNVSSEETISLILPKDTSWEVNLFFQTGWSIALGTVMGTSIVRVLIIVSSSALSEILQNPALLSFYKVAAVLCDCPNTCMIHPYQLF